MNNTIRTPLIRTLPKFTTRADAEAEIATINGLIEDLQNRVDGLKDAIEGYARDRDVIENVLDDLPDDEDEEAAMTRMQEELERRGAS